MTNFFFFVYPYKSLLKRDFSLKLNRFGEWLIPSVLCLIMLKCLLELECVVGLQCVPF